MKHILRVIVLVGIMFGLYYTLTSQSKSPTQVHTSSPSTQATTSPQPDDKEIEVKNIKEGQYISSPLTITGTARGWYFEGSFPVTLTKLDGTILAIGIATANGDWMTTDPVEFSSTLEWVADASITDGILVFKKDNPSGDPERDRSFTMKVKLQN